LPEYLVPTQCGGLVLIFPRKTIRVLFFSVEPGTYVLGRVLIFLADALKKFSKHHSAVGFSFFLTKRPGLKQPSPYQAYAGR
jgi:hypothetical protein